MTGTPARIGLILGAALLAWLTVAVTYSNYAAATSPSTSLFLWPGHAVAEARTADALVASIQQNTPSRQQRQRVAEAAQAAARALQRNPTLPAPVRILAMQASLGRDQRPVDRLLDYSQRMSRRDVPTQFWLLEKRVAANDVPGALSHFGIALQVAPSTREVLFPVLSQALSQPDLREPIARLVRRGDSWRSEYLYHAGQHADPASAAALFLLVARLGAPPAPAHLQGLVERLAAAGDVAGAARLYALVDRDWRLGDVGAQLDGTFARSGDLPPFGWDLNPNNAARGPRPDSNDNNALQINLPQTDEEWAARKLLLAAAGRYRFAGAYGMMDGGTGRIRIEIACARGGAVVATISAVVNRPTGALEGQLDIPASCTRQWLTIQASGQGNDTAGRMWLDDLRLTRVTG